MARATGFEPETPDGAPGSVGSFSDAGLGTDAGVSYWMRSFNVSRVPSNLVGPCTT